MNQHTHQSWVSLYFMQKRPSLANRHSHFPAIFSPIMRSNHPEVGSGACHHNFGCQIWIRLSLQYCNIFSPRILTVLNVIRTAAVTSQIEDRQSRKHSFTSSDEVSTLCSSLSGACRIVPWAVCGHFHFQEMVSWVIVPSLYLIKTNKNELTHFRTGVWYWCHYQCQRESPLRQGPRRHHRCRQSVRTSRVCQQ